MYREYLSIGGIEAKGRFLSAKHFDVNAKRDVVSIATFNRRLSFITKCMNTKELEQFTRDVGKANERKRGPRGVTVIVAAIATRHSRSRSSLQLSRRQLH